MPCTHATVAIVYRDGFPPPPIGRATKVWKEHGALKASMIFASSGFAQSIKRHVAERPLRSTSMGFRPLKFEFSKERRGSIDFIEQELLEFSIVSVPANPEALIELSASDKAWLHRQRQRQRQFELIKLQGGP